MEVYSVDPAPLALAPERMQRVHWVSGMSFDEGVLERLRHAAPFDVIVSDMNQLPDELARCFEGLVPMLVSGGYVIVTIKLSHLRPTLQMARGYAKGCRRFLSYFATAYPHLKPVGNVKWLLQNKNERCAVFKSDQPLPWSVAAVQ